jgi:hypothetical protein
MTYPGFRSVVFAAASLFVHGASMTAQELLPAVQVRTNFAWAGEFWPGDFNGDGVTDLAVRRDGSGLVTISLGGGGEIPSATEGRPRAAADVDRDGAEDVVAFTGTAIVVLPGNGDGTLGSPRTVLAADATFAIVADMNGDGHRDVVIGEHGDSLHVVPGNGDLTFQPPATLTTGTFPHGATVADVNGDDRLDIAVAHRYDNRVVVFRNDGGLLFTRSDIVVDHPSTDVIARDLNGDGDPDLAVTVREGADGDFGFDYGAVYVFPGNGDATFGARQEFPTLNGPGSLAAGDFTHDGTLDIATTNGPQFRFDNPCGEEFGPESLSILPGNGDGTFGPPTSFLISHDAVLDAFGALNTSDLNGDGFPDLLVGSGYMLLTEEPRANEPPVVVSAGDDRVVRNTNQISLHGQVIDPDDHYLTYSWSDGGAGGHVFAPTLRTCYEAPFEGGIFTLTLTADDGNGGVGSDTVNISYVPSEEGGDWIGQPVFEATGSFTYEDGTYTVSGSGLDIWRDEDDFYFASINASGDFDFTAHVTSVENVHRWTKAGLMLRRSVSPGSPHVSIFATPTTEKGLAFQRRLETEGESVHTAGPAIAPPVWLRLSRRGATITAFYRVDETDPWTAIASDSLPPTEGDRVGFAVSSHVGETEATATFESVTFEGVDGGPGGLPAGWSNTDIGAVGAQGAASFADGTFTVEGSGADIWGTADELHYASRTISGDFEVTARVAEVENVNRWTKAGLMLREGLGAGARHASIFATPTTQKPVSFQRRPVAGGESVHTAGPSTTPPLWLRLTRTGDVITAFYRKNEADAWTEIGSQTLTGLAADLRVGLAVSSHVDGTVATAQFDDVEVSEPGGTLPFGWSSADIGSVGAAGSAVHADGTFTVEGSGADIWDSADEFHFVSRTWNLGEGAVEVIARVASVENVDRWTKAGIMVRHTLDPDSPHAMLIVTPTTEKGVAFQRRPQRGGASVHTAGPAATAPIWFRLVAQGPDVRAYYRLSETDSWTLIGEQRLEREFGSELEVGLVVTSHEDGALATAEFDNVIVRVASGT